MTDAGTRSTDNDASHCKRWCVEKGYYQDDFIHLFVPSTTPKTPEMSRGYYARVQAFRSRVESFCRENSDGQVISLGAGSDTLYWHLLQQGLSPTYLELDFPEMTMRKGKVIRRKAVLKDPLGEGEFGPGIIHTKSYHLIGMDLRDTRKLDQLKTYLDTSKPTLVLAECVLCYVPHVSTDQLLAWLSGAFPNLAFLNYEPCNMGDRFGSIMIENMRARDCELPGILACPTLIEQEQRFLKAGFTAAKNIVMVLLIAQHPLSSNVTMVTLNHDNPYPGIAPAPQLGPKPKAAGNIRSD
eukprot:sb/3467450/